MLYPLQFKPIFQERIWGGRQLERLYGKQLPSGRPIGESWEISDRPEAQSEIENGPLKGRTLGWLMQHHRAELLGRAPAPHGRFPLLVKILDAEDVLSLQVHPPEAQAAALRGEPKTEMWYITRAHAHAHLFAGLKAGMTRARFEAAVASGTAGSCVHRIPVRAGDAMFLPSGRVHAIGGGLVLFEIQQNSDTTYRVFDWNRVDAAGQSRALHVRESLASIDFTDFEPEPIRADPPAPQPANVHIQSVVEHPLFSVEVVSTVPPSHIEYGLSAPKIIGVIAGTVRVLGAKEALELGPGQFCLVPAALGRLQLESLSAAKFLIAEPGGCVP